MVITTGDGSYAADAFRAAGWKLESLGGFWQLATDPKAGGRDCT